ncbi:aminotransferase class V-fold PLP-dependent enzyme [Pendulispora brunnea]|uniref:Aminotransferase class V-fold PLP-dependent enzyme n=1 Tax=Pendulispora brunnea TaxID=2905690 RepID=A0ABZ2JYX6_9BACT
MKSGPDSGSHLDMPLDVRKLRAQFPILERCIYLNSNSTGLAPRGVQEVLSKYWDTLDDWRDDTWETWWSEIHRYADDIAAFLGAPAGSVLCDVNVATLLGRFAAALEYDSGRNRIVTSDLEFPTAELLFRGLHRLGAETIVVPSRDGYSIDEEAIVRTIDERTRLVFLSLATSNTGALLALGPIVEQARKVGALVALDAYAALGVVPLDVTELGADVLFGGASKWLCGPYHAAFMYMRPELAARLVPLTPGWMASRNPLTFRPQTELAEGTRRFAGGTPLVLPLMMARVGFELMRSFGIARVRELSLAHTQRIIDHADEAGLTVTTPRAPQRRAGIVSLHFENDEQVVRDLAGRAEGQRQMVCSYRCGVRIGPHAFNTESEIDTFMKALVESAIR